MNTFYKVAREISFMSDMDRMRIGAVLVKRKSIVSSGFCKMKSHPKQQELNRHREERKHCCSATHAEMATITSCELRDLSSCELYIYREDMNGELAMCRPCAACMKIIKGKRIKTIHYTTTDGFVTERIKY